MRDNPKPYELYRNAKGCVCQIVAVAKRGETGEDYVVYRELYDPGRVYVETLPLFMGETDGESSGVKQRYRFAKIALETGKEAEEAQNEAPGSPRRQYAGTDQTGTQSGADGAGGDPDGGTVNPALMRFLDAESYEEKIETLHAIKKAVDQDVLRAIAMSLDLEISEGTLEEQYEEVMNCLLTMEKYECSRLR